MTNMFLLGWFFIIFSIVFQVSFMEKLLDFIEY